MQLKIVALRKKVQREKRKAIFAKYRVDLLSKELSERQKQISEITNGALDKKCSKEKIPETQRIVLQEILTSSKVENSKGRRYSHEFIMLCMLLNIRSQSNYEYLQRHEILSLPCHNTLRNYLSILSDKCGYDDDYFQLLKKSFEQKNTMNRNGLLIVDEINLRKSVAVSAKNLTYVGLTDMGDKAMPSNDFSDLATHGLVITFQLIADGSTQTIGVFASANAVAGDELAKILIQGICKIENIGANIHGIISDGASTNRKMWKALGVKSSINDSKCWFTHPLDVTRKVFVFSDTPHLIKRIRNRLYNNDFLIVRVPSEKKTI